jgi:cardiolipin synthase (CMP-forming)
MNLANWLTASRIFLIPVFITMLLQDRMLWALGAFIAAAVTDILDGYIARRTHTTTLGRFLDPAADKLMLVSAFVILPLIDGIPIWVTAVVVSRDVIITLGYWVTYLTWGSAKITVRPLGKVTTLSQIVGVGLVMLERLFHGPHWFVLVALYIVAGITIASGVDYVLFGIRQASFLHGESPESVDSQTSQPPKPNL